MAYYGNSLLGDLRRAGLALGSDLITSLLVKPMLMKKAEAAEMRKLGATAVLGGLANTPAGQEHVSAQQALAKLGIDLPLMDVETRTPQSVPEYERAKRLTVPAGLKFTPPPKISMQPKVVGVGPASLDDVMARLAMQEGKSFDEIMEAKTAGTDLLSKILLMRATKGEMGAGEAARLDEQMRHNRTVEGLQGTNAQLNALGKSLQQLRMDQLREKGVRDQAESLTRNMEEAMDEQSFANYYKQYLDLQTANPKVRLTEPRIPDKYRSFAERHPVIGGTFGMDVTPAEERFGGAAGAPATAPAKKAPPATFSGAIFTGQYDPQGRPIYKTKDGKLKALEGF